MKISQLKIALEKLETKLYEELVSVCLDDYNSESAIIFITPEKYSNKRTLSSDIKRFFKYAFNANISMKFDTYNNWWEIDFYYEYKDCNTTFIDNFKTQNEEEIIKSIKKSNEGKRRLLIHNKVYNTIFTLLGDLSTDKILSYKYLNDTKDTVSYEVIVRSGEVKLKVLQLNLKSFRKMFNKINSVLVKYDINSYEVTELKRELQELYNEGKVFPQMILFETTIKDFGFDTSSYLTLTNESKEKISVKNHKDKFLLEILKEKEILPL